LILQNFCPCNASFRHHRDPFLSLEVAVEAHPVEAVAVEEVVSVAVEEVVSVAVEVAGVEETFVEAGLGAEDAGKTYIAAAVLLVYGGSDYELSET